MASVILYALPAVVVVTFIGALVERSQKEQRRQSKLCLAFERARKDRMKRGEDLWSPMPPTSR